MKAVGVSSVPLDPEQKNFEYLLRKIKKQSKFVQKMMRIASDATGHKLESLHDCVKWARGLQKEFSQLYAKVEDKLQTLMANQK